jgi:hypothetical protein
MILLRDSGTRGEDGRVDHNDRRFEDGGSDHWGAGSHCDVNEMISRELECLEQDEVKTRS